MPHPSRARPEFASLVSVQLTVHTDYAFRTLVALGLCAPGKMTAAEIGAAYGVSVHHLLKVIQQLSEHGYVETLRGKSGGVRLAKPPEQISVGAVVRSLERDLGVVACLREGGEPCIIDGACRLRAALNAATNAFLSVLDAYTLADILKPRSKLTQLLQLRLPEQSSA
jgi:Rrf2 family transcriptional regulator, nitric oxide-sensitive transcriptional repressor